MDVPVPNYIKRDKVVEKVVIEEVYVDKVVNKEISVPIEKVVVNEVPVFVDKVVDRIVYKEVPVEKVNSFLRKVILCSRIPDPSKWLFFFWLDNHERGPGCGGEDRIPRS